MISGLDYYRVDSTLSVAVDNYDTYVLNECGTYETCTVFDTYDTKLREYINTFGAFEFEPVFSKVTENAKVRVYRLHNRR